MGVFADLEDAVVAVRDWLAALVAGEVPQWVWINDGARGLDDLPAVRGPVLAGACVPRMRGPADVEAVGSGVGVP